MLRKQLLCLSRCLLAVFCCLSTFTACAAAKSEAFDPNRFADICASGKLEALREALDQGADPNIGPDKHPSWKLQKNPVHIRPGDSPLMIAVRSNANQQAIQALLAAGAKPGYASPHGYTALMEAARARNGDTSVRLLLDAGADANTMNARGASALHYALQNTNPEAARLLLAAGANPLAQDREGKTTLHHAVIPEYIQLLVKAGVDVNTPDTFDGSSPLNTHTAHGHGNTLDALLAAGANVDARNNFGRTPLMQAATYAHSPELIRQLLAAGADVNARNNFGQTVLMEALYNSYGLELQVCTLLLQAGADVRARDDEGATALMLAAAMGSNPDLLRLLLDAGSELDARDTKGKNALAYVGTRHSTGAAQKKAFLRKAMAAAKPAIKPQ